MNGHVVDEAQDEIGLAFVFCTGRRLDEARLHHAVDLLEHELGEFGILLLAGEHVLDERLALELVPDVRLLEDCFLL